jgi:hypothetical protein
MNQPELFDIIELLIDLPEHHLIVGEQGAIVECYNDDAYEVEFTNSDGETRSLCTLYPQQFIVVWKAQTRTWLSLSDILISLIQKLSEQQQREVLDLARCLYVKSGSTLTHPISR